MVICIKNMYFTQRKYCNYLFFICIQTKETFPS